MIGHYLKVALRNLLKYKVQNIVSALCLAIGIVVFSMVYLFVDRFADAYSRLPDSERRVLIRAYGEEAERNIPFYLSAVNELVSRTEGALDSVSVHSATLRMDVDVIGKDSRNLPYIVQYMVTNSCFFSYFNLPLLYGNYVPTLPNEIIISSDFAGKIAKNSSPVGMVVRLNSLEPGNGIRDYRIVNVADVSKDGLELNADCYFPLEVFPYARTLVYALIPEGQTLNRVNKALSDIGWNDGEQKISVEASPVSGQTGTLLAKYLVLILASLILVSGLINFLKFTFQMFYARQHELALRKSLGSDMKGVFGLLSTEVFCMLSFAFLLSLVLLESMLPLAYRYLPEETTDWFIAKDCYLTQAALYLMVLLVCLCIVIYPVWRVRGINLMNRIRTNGQKHSFRAVMICIQLFVSMGFLGAVIIIHLSYGELRGRLYYPEKVEENRIVSIDMNTDAIRKNWDVIHSEINSMAEIEGQTFVKEESNNGLLSYQFTTFLKHDSAEVNLKVMTGNPDYFRFFHIPLRGKILEAEMEGVVYISQSFADLLRHENAEGMVKLGNRTYQIAGVYEDLYRNMTGNDEFAGSVFFPTRDFKVWLLKVASGRDVDEVMKKIKAVCRKYVPDTLPLDVYKYGKRTVYSSMQILETMMWILAAVSLLLVVLSVYSSISMDSVARQKEVAIRKINGASRKDIVMLFARSYIAMFLLMFLFVYPILRLAMINALEGSSLKSVYGWEWGIILFVVMALLITLAVGWQIIKLMKVNPAQAIKKE